MILIRQLLNLALPPWGREGHFFPSTYYTTFTRTSAPDDPSNEPAQNIAPFVVEKKSENYSPFSERLSLLLHELRVIIAYSTGHLY